MVIARTQKLVAATVMLAASASCGAQQTPVRQLDESVLREYAGVYEWDRDAFVYLQPWSELGGTNQLVAFDESGEVRTLYPEDRDHFFAGPGAAISSPVESRIEFQRDASGQIAWLTWRRNGSPPRTARRVDNENREDVRFANGDVRLAGTLSSRRVGAGSYR